MRRYLSKIERWCSSKQCNFSLSHIDSKDEEEDEEEEDEEEVDKDDEEEGLARLFIKNVHNAFINFKEEEEEEDGFFKHSSCRLNSLIFVFISEPGKG